MFFSGIIPLQKDFIFVKSSIGLGYYNNKMNKQKDAYLDLSSSLNLSPVRNVYFGTQITSMILVSDKRYDYFGLVAGFMF